MKQIIIPAIILTSISLTSCTKIHNTGNFVKTAAIEDIQKNNLTQKDVIKKIGSPSLKSKSKPETWYYVYQTTQNSVLTMPKITDQQILELQFDTKGKLVYLKLRQDEHNANVKIISESTNSSGLSNSKILQFIKNFGRFNKEEGVE